MNIDKKSMDAEWDRIKSKRLPTGETLEEHVDAMLKIVSEGRREYNALKEQCLFATCLITDDKGVPISEKVHHIPTGIEVEDVDEQTCMFELMRLLKEKMASCVN